MAFNSLRLEYALDGNSNYIAWKDCMEAVLEDNGLKDFIDQEVPKPTNATELAEWKKCVARARRIFLEGVRDHIVSSLHGKETPFSMWKTLKDIYQNSSGQRKLALKDKLVSLVSLALLVLPKSWHSYQDSVNGREKLPNWE